MDESLLIDRFDQQYLWHPYASMVRPQSAYKVALARGCTIELADGTKLLDAVSSWWCMIHGYCRTEINSAITEQLNKFSHVMFAGFTHEKAIELGKRLHELLPKELSQIFYADSGSVAVEAAMKMAIQYQAALGLKEKNNFATFRGGYHGDTFNAMSVCDPVDGMHSIFGSSLPVRFFLNRPAVPIDGEFAEDSAEVQEIEEFFKTHHQDLAGFIAEPIAQLAGGMYFYHPGYLKLIRRLCDTYGIVLIFDEIATGFYRTGPCFAFQHADAAPDIITLGKALTGGAVTLSAVVVREEISSAISKAAPHAFMHGPTFMANPLACAAACASLEIMKKCDYQAIAEKFEARFKDYLQKLKNEYPKQILSVRALGGIAAVSFPNAVIAKKVSASCIAAGLWIRPIGEVSYFMPPYVMSDEEFARMLEIYALAVKSVLAS